MGSTDHGLDRKSSEILRMLAEGVPDQEILDGHPDISRADITRAAVRALALLAHRAPASHPIEAIRQTHPRAYEPWRPEEEQQLLEMHRAGIEVRDIAKKLQRQTGAVSSRLARLRPAENHTPAAAEEVPEPEAAPGEDPPAEVPGVRCRKCREPIPPARLEAVPGTEFCVRCQDSVEQAEPEEEDNGPCPRCGSKLIWRQPRDPTETTWFLGCSAYPRCRYIDPDTGFRFKRRGLRRPQG